MRCMVYFTTLSIGCISIIYDFATWDIMFLNGQLSIIFHVLRFSTSYFIYLSFKGRFYPFYPCYGFYQWFICRVHISLWKASSFIYFIHVIVHLMYHWSISYCASYVSLIYIIWIVCLHCSSLLYLGIYINCARIYTCIFSDTIERRMSCVHYQLLWACMTFYVWFSIIHNIISSHSQFY